MSNAARSLQNGIVLGLGVAFFYFLIATLVLASITPYGEVSIFWPAAGVSAGALIAFGLRWLVPVVSGVFAAALAANLLSGVGGTAAVLFALFNSAEAVLIAFLVERMSGDRFRLDRLRGVFQLFVATVLSCALIGLGAALCLREVGHSVASVWSLAGTWFAADVIGVVTVAPLVLSIRPTVSNPPSPLQVAEGAFVLAALALTATTVFSTSPGQGDWYTIAPLALLLPLLYWLAFRCPPAFGAAGIALVSFVTVWNMVNDRGVFADESYGFSDRLLAAQAFLLITSLSTLAVAALVAQRRTAELALKESRDSLELAHQAAQLGTWDINLRSSEISVGGHFFALRGLPNGNSFTYRDWLRSMHPEDRAQTHNLFRQAIRSNGTFTGEFRVIWPDGTVRWLAARGRVLPDAAGQPDRMIGVSWDVSSRKASEGTQRLLLGELSHRVKNTLAMVQAIASQTRRHTSDPDAFVASFNGRIEALARAHSILTRAAWRGAELGDLVREQLAMGEASERIACDGPKAMLTSHAALHLGLVIHELGANARKYGALSVPEGRLSITWTLEGAGLAQGLRLRWNERGGPPVALPKRTSFGTELIEKSLRHALKATTHLIYEPAGLICEIELPPSALEREKAAGARE